MPICVFAERLPAFRHAPRLLLSHVRHNHRLFRLRMGTVIVPLLAGTLPAGHDGGRPARRESIAGELKESYFDYGRVVRLLRREIVVVVCTCRFSSDGVYGFGDLQAESHHHGNAVHLHPVLRL